MIASAPWPSLKGSESLVQSTPRPVGEQTVILYHATPRRNYTSILCRGPLTAMSQGALKGVWLCEPARQHWACMHAVRRHGGRIEGVIVVKVEVPRDWLKRHGNHNGLWRCSCDIPPRFFRRISGFGELSASPVKCAA